MQIKLYIKLRERGSPQVISHDDWARSGCASDATELVRLGVIKISQTGPFFIIEPKTLVGVFDSPRLRLEVVSKSPALTSNLLHRLDNWRKYAKADDPSSSGDYTKFDSLWETFRVFLAGLHREGIPWTYARRSEKSSTPRGRILFRDTLITLASKGINHQIISSAQVRDYFESLAPALDAVRRRIVKVETGTASVRSQVSRLIELTGDMSAPTPDLQAKEAFNELSDIEGRPALFALSTFCLDILRGDYSVRTSQNVGFGVAEFVDLEKLWENAIQMLVQQHYVSTDDRVVLHPLRSRRLSLFHDGGPNIDPDIITYVGSTEHVVVDAKYSIGTSPSADDVYQLSSYLSRLSAQIGILAYVADGVETEIKMIGTLDDGRKLFACYLTLDAFTPERRVLDSLLAIKKSVAEVA